MWLLRNIDSNVKTRATTNVCLHVPTFCYETQHNQTGYRHSIHHVRSNDYKHAMSQHNGIYQNCYCGSAIIAMPSWDVINCAPLQWKLAEGGLSLLVSSIAPLCRHSPFSLSSTFQVRLQTQGSHGMQTRYKGAVNCFISIAKSEGVSRKRKGLDMM